VIWGAREAEYFCKGGWTGDHRNSGSDLPNRVVFRRCLRGREAALPPGYVATADLPIFRSFAPCATHARAEQLAATLPQAGIDGTVRLFPVPLDADGKVKRATETLAGR
jgi:hypothetical protein